MDKGFSPVTSLVFFVCVVFSVEIVASDEGQCQRNCLRFRDYMARFAFSEVSLAKSFSACKAKCVNPIDVIKVPTTNKPDPITQPTRPPIVWTPPPTREPIVWTPPTRKPIVWTPPPTRKPIVWTPPLTRKPIVWIPPTTRKPIVWTPPPTRKPIVWTPPPTRKPIVWRPPTTRKPFVWTPPPTRKLIRPPQIGCGYRRSFTSRIIRGDVADSCEFPWMVLIRIPGNLCGGTILDKRHILTAAHCLKHAYIPYQKISASQIKVQLNSSRMSQMVSVQVLRTDVHARHTKKAKEYDVGVITLDKDLEFGPCIAPICLPSEGQKAEYMDECYSAGWGKVTIPVSDRKPSETLQKLKLPVVNQAVCSKNYRRKAVIYDTMLCAGYLSQGSRATCNGDSGGPLMCRNGNGPFIEFGIVSFGYRICARPGYPDVFTRVNHPLVMEYILNIINSV